jgi:hypothetical protein
MLNFPPWATTIRAYVPPLAAGGLLYVVTLVWYGGSPLTTDVGYAPVQPVPYSHALHAGVLGMNCLYCHTNVDKAAHANVPATQTCMNCHQRIKAKSPQLAPVRQSWATDEPVEWVKVHDLPDFVYFNHSAHITKGVGCVSCHGRIDTMERVSQREKLSMGWCLECHRAPEKNLRPPELVTAMDWQPPEDPQVYGAKLKEINHINPPVHCSGCHR